MTAYWIKLYHEMLYDPKIGKLPVDLKWRFIELLLLAGENHKDGLLPPIEEIAWKLRADEEQLETDLIELQRAKLLSNSEGNWLVTNFKKRQSPLSCSEYMRRKREYNHKKNYYQIYNDEALGMCDESVRNPNTSLTNHSQFTNPDIDIDIDIESDIDTDTEAEKEAEKEKSDCFFSESFSPDIEAERIFQDVTGLVIIPGKNRFEDLEKIRAIASQKHERVRDYLRQFWEAWLDRGYSKTNTAWLDWALADEIPKKRTMQPTPDEDDWKRKYSIA